METIVSRCGPPKENILSNKKVLQQRSRLEYIGDLQLEIAEIAL
jgi:hypothetical protein